MEQREEDLLALALEHIAKLLHDPAEPDIPAELADNEQLRGIHGYLSRMRELLNSYATGDFSPAIRDRGVFAGRLKTLQANLRHMVWQVKQVAEGDFDQRVHFLGEFSESFNSMVAQLDAALTTMRNKEAELTALSQSLQEEIAKRNLALQALERSEAEFRYLAEHDPLTGVLNRRSFFNLADIEMQRSAMNKEDCCLIMLDVDFFKRFNDSYGHLEGDKALKHVAAIGKKTLRQKDILARFGGEEFVFLLPYTNLEKGHAVAERIRRSIATTPVMLDQGKEVFVTASLGLVALPTREQEAGSALLARAISAADEALYQAKEQGRNVVCVASIDDVCAPMDVSGIVCYQGEPFTS
jgi:diguanylate cyclase (GGDEF)-like protein